MLKLLDVLLVHLDLLRVHSEVLDQGDIWVTQKLSQEVNEWLFELVVGFGRDVIVLEVSLSVETDLAGLDFSVFDVGLISNETNGNVGTDLGEVLVPFVDISIGVSGGEVEHDDGTVGLDIITLSEFSEFFLTSSVPNIKGDFSKVSVENDVGHLSTLGWDVWFLEVSSVVSLGEGCLADTSVSDENEFELGSDILRH